MPSPKILLIRGRAELDFVDGIPDEYLKATNAYEMMCPGFSSFWACGGSVSPYPDEVLGVRE